MSKNKVISFAVITAVAISAVLLLANKPSPDKGAQRSDLTPVKSFQHAHGLAVDPTDSKKVYIATHNGLFLWENDQNLYQVGKATDDYMGFSIHPTSGQTFFTSGHPTTGGNLGFQKSGDGGRSWKKLSNGVGGPVDFHAMAVSQANPDLIYGFYKGQLQRSTDGGSTWQSVPGKPMQIISLTTHPTEPDTVYAATNTGLQVSKDKGQTWQPLGATLSGAVAVLAINPANPVELMAYSETSGLTKSVDGGQTWTPAKADFAQQVVLHLAYDKQVPKTIYALTQENKLHKSNDGGTSWQQVR